MIYIDSLTKKYKTREKVVTALNAVTYRFPDTGLVFVVGKSGSGKSTLLNMLGGFDFATSGKIMIDDLELNRCTVSQLDAYRNNYVGFIFQSYNLINDFTVEQNIGYVLELQGKTNFEGEVEKVLSDVDLSDVKGQKANELSGGQQQRVAIARAIVKNPRLILADEPTGNLDVEATTQVFELLKQISRDRLVIVVTHDLESARQYGDEIVKISNGKIVDCPEKEESPYTPHAADIGKARHWKLKTAFRYGTQSFTKEFYKMFLGIFLAIIAFTGFASALLFNLTESDALRFENIEKANLESVIVKTDYHKGFSYDKMLQIIGAHPDLKLNKMFYAGDGDECLTDRSQLQKYDTDDLSYYLEINETNKSYFENRLLEGSRFANNEHEVVIPLSFAEAALHCGFKHYYWKTHIVENHFGEEIRYETYRELVWDEIKIDLVTDLIGKTMRNSYYFDSVVTIVGIFDNRIENFDELKEFDERNRNKELTMAEGFYYSGLSISYRTAKDYYLDIGLVHNTFTENSRDSWKDKDYHVLQLVLDPDRRTEEIDRLEKEGYNVETLADYYVREAESLRVGMSATFFLISLVVGAFACLLMFYVFNNNIGKNKRRIGIMRSLGTKSGDIFLMYCVQGLLVGLLIFAITAPLSFGAVQLITYSLLHKWGYRVLGVPVEVVLSIFDPMMLLYLFGAILAGIFIAIIFPILKIRKIAPIIAVRQD